MRIVSTWADDPGGYSKKMEKMMRMGDMDFMIIFPGNMSNIIKEAEVVQLPNPKNCIYFPFISSELVRWYGFIIILLYVPF